MAPTRPPALRRSASAPVSPSAAAAASAVAFVVASAPAPAAASALAFAVASAPARVPCGALVVAPLPVPQSAAEFHEIVRGTRTRAPNGLRVGGPFRWYSDPQFDGDARFDPEGETCWFDSGDFRFPGEGRCYMMIVSLAFALPAAAASVADDRLDLAAVPNVFRSAARLFERTAASDDYRGGLRHGVWHAGGAQTYSYKRVVQGSRSTTVRELYDAVAHAEGWDGRDAPCDGCPEHAQTVSSVMADAAPDSDDQEDFYLRGGAVMCRQWPADYTTARAGA